MRLVYYLICCTLILLFVLSYILQSGDSNIVNFYLNERLELLITIFISLSTCVIGIYRLSRNSLTGSWHILAYPKDSRQAASVKHEGTMIIYEKNKNEYFGNLQFDSYTNGVLMSHAFYEISLKKKLTKIVGESNVKFVKTLDPDFVAEDASEVMRFLYELRVISYNKIEGKGDSDDGAILSHFTAERH